MRTVVQVQSHWDLTAVLGNDLKGLGLELLASIAGDEAVKRLCAEINPDPRLAGVLGGGGGGVRNTSSCSA